MEEDQQIEISVCDPQKVGSGINSYVAYKVTTSTNLPYFEKTTFSVSRRFSDFFGLNDKLVEKYQHLGIIIPPVPGKSTTEMTKIKMSIGQTVLSDNEFIEKRRVALERYLKRTASHPVLRTDPDFREFLEKESDFPKTTNSFALSGAGAIRFFNALGNITKESLKIDEPGSWFEIKQRQIQKLEEDLSTMYGKVEDLFHRRKELSTSTASFAESAINAAYLKENNAFSKSLSQLAQVEGEFKKLQSQQANRDLYLLSELLMDSISLASVVKKVFRERVKVYEEWQSRCQTVIEKEENEDKIRYDYLHYFVVREWMELELKDAERETMRCKAFADEGKEEFVDISKMIRVEVERFEQTMMQDIKRAIDKYVEIVLEGHQQIFECLKSLVPNA